MTERRDEVRARAAEDRRRLLAQAQSMVDWSQRLADRADAMVRERQRAVASEETRRLAAEPADREAANAERFVAVLEQMPIGVLLAEAPSGRILMYNAAAIRLLGQPLLEVGDYTGYAQFGAVHADGTPYTPDEYPLVRAVLHGETTVGEDMVYRRGDGAKTDFWVTAAPIRDADGRAVLAVSTFEDVSARRVLERTREEFLAAATHDLKTPLTSMSANAQLARRQLRRLADPEVETAVHHIRQIEEGINQQVRLINELLDMARLEMGAPLELAWRSIDLVAIARGVVARLGGAEGQVTVETDGSVLPVKADQARLERVLGNLLNNAVKYSPPDSPIVVRVGQEQGPNGPVAVIAVRDEGVGIPAADLPYIFERFHRAGNVIGHIQGTGIGLAGALAIVEHHGGTIGVESVEGRGSTFTVRLPAGVNEGDDAATAGSKSVAHVEDEVKEKVTANPYP